MILQLKTGALDTAYFQQKFGVDVWNEFQPSMNGWKMTSCSSVTMARLS